MNKANDVVDDLTSANGKINRALETMEFTMHVERDSNQENREHWIASEIAQVLRLAFEDHSSTTVWIDTAFADAKPDIKVSGKYDGNIRDYPIEIKRANKESMNRLESQLRNQRSLPNFTRGFVFVYVEDDHYHPKNNQNVKEELEYAENHKKFDVIIKTSESARQKL